MVRGTLQFAECACAFVDPLARLDAPEDDRTLLRTHPRLGPSTEGAVSIEVLPGMPDVVRFVARLPERYGAVGHVDGWGLRAAGGWYPQPVDGAGMPVVGTWEVVVRAADPDVPVVVNGVVGEGSARWSGESDRVGLAVVPRGVVSEVEVAGGIVRFVERRRPEAFVHRQVEALLAEGWPLGAPALTVVEGMDLRRLAVATPGMVFLSDRAFRLTRPLARYHQAPVREALVAAAVPRPDGWERAFVAAGLVRGLPLPNVQRLLGWLSWNPVIDQLLHDGSLPFYPEIFDEAFADPADLVDRVGGRIPGRAAARQVETVLGADGLAAVTAAVLRGEGLGEAVPAVLREGWSRPYPEAQNYRVEVTRGEPPRLVREAPADAPAEVVAVRVDGAPVAPWIAGPGPAERALGLEPRSIALDPAGDTAQTDRVDDRWPSRWNVVLSGGLYDLSPTQGSFSLEGVAVLRRSGDTRNRYMGGISHDTQDLFGLWVGYLRYLGGLLDRQVRAHRLSFSFGPSLLDPAWRPTESGAVALGGGLGYAWDTRQGDESLSGHRLSVGVGGGVVPGSAERWASAGLGGVKLVPLAARSVLAMRLGGSWASGRVEHRLLPLGGADLLRSVVDHEVLGNERVIAAVELRQALFRHASLPLPLLWLDEVQVAPGVEAGALWRDGDGRYTAVGATLGVHVVVDAFGARPVFVGTSLAHPLWSERLSSSGLQAYLDFKQAF